MTTVAHCPCCGQETGSASINLAFLFSGYRRRIVEALLESNGKTVRQLVDLVYYDDPNGGPDAPEATIYSQITHINRVLRKHGFTIERRGKCVLQPWVGSQPEEKKRKGGLSPIHQKVLDGLTERPMTRAELEDYVWGNAKPATSRDAIWHMVSKVRKHLIPQGLDVTTPRDGEPYRIRRLPT